MTLSIDDLKKLSAPFSKDKLGVKVQSLSKDKSKAMLILYLQHTDVMDRLESVDPAWSAETVETFHLGDTYYVKMKMTVLGVTRENVGDGNEPKGAYSDALKRCAMLFGLGRFLYDSETVWVPYNENQDKYRVWTMSDYEKKITPIKPEPQLNPAHYPNSIINKDLGDYIITYGGDKGKRLKDVSVDRIENSLAYWETELSRSGKPAGGPLKLYMEAMHAYLDSLNSNLMNESDVP